MIKITEKAVTKAIQLAERQGVPKILRVGVRGGGCSGLSYFLDFVEDVRDSDTVVEHDGLKVICDPKSINFLKETEIDYESNLMNGGFKFNNPLAKRSCSCGESFAV